MNHLRLLIVLTAFILNTPLPSLAQATRTWVSGVGDDANTCARTAPCKTFAGAIGKTAAGGEIGVLDSADYGGVTITKSISIESEGAIAKVLVSGTNGIVINAGPTDLVVLRGLTFEGMGTGLAGVNFNSGAALYVEKCTINNFLQKGIDVRPAAAAKLFVTDTILRNNIGTNSGGIFIGPPNGSSVSAALTDVILENNEYGLTVQSPTRVVLTRVVAANNAQNGILASSTGPATIMTIENSTVSTNGASGIKAEGSGTTVRIANNTITGNTGPGLLRVVGGKIFSFGNNNVGGNSPNGNPTGTLNQR